jgi:hypothetical protein
VTVKNSPLWGAEHKRRRARVRAEECSSHSRTRRSSVCSVQNDWVAQSVLNSASAGWLNQLSNSRVQEQEARRREKFRSQSTQKRESSEKSADSWNPNVEDSAAGRWAARGSKNPKPPEETGRQASAKASSGRGQPKMTARVWRMRAFMPAASVSPCVSGRERRRWTILQAPRQERRMSKAACGGLSTSQSPRRGCVESL